MQKSQNTRWKKYGIPLGQDYQREGMPESKNAEGHRKYIKILSHTEGLLKILSKISLTYQSSTCINLATDTLQPTIFRSVQQTAFDKN